MDPETGAGSGAHEHGAVAGGVVVPGVMGSGTEVRTLVVHRGTRPGVQTRENPRNLEKLHEISIFLLNFRDFLHFSAIFRSVSGQFGSNSGHVGSKDG